MSFYHGLPSYQMRISPESGMIDIRVQSVCLDNLRYRKDQYELRSMTRLAVRQDIGTECLCDSPYDGQTQTDSGDSASGHFRSKKRIKDMRKISV